jgi:hypothetical protein
VQAIKQGTQRRQEDIKQQAACVAAAAAAGAAQVEGVSNGRRRPQGLAGKGRQVAVDGFVEEEEEGAIELLSSSEEEEGEEEEEQGVMDGGEEGEEGEGEEEEGEEEYGIAQLVSRGLRVVGPVLDVLAFTGCVCTSCLFEFESMLSFQSLT